jgi:hypothetical protein
MVAAGYSPVDAGKDVRTLLVIADIFASDELRHRFSFDCD